MKNGGYSGMNLVNIIMNGFRKALHSFLFPFKQASLNKNKIRVIKNIKIVNMFFSGKAGLTWRYH